MVELPLKLQLGVWAPAFAGEQISVVAAGFGAGFEQVEQGAMLEQQLLAAERQGAIARRPFGGGVDDLDHRGSRRAATEPGIAARRGPRRDRAGGGSATSPRPARSRRRARSRCAPTEQGSRARGARRPGSTSVSAAPGVLGIGPTADGQADQIKPLALERFGGSASHAWLGPCRAALKRELDQAGMAAVEAAQQMHRVGEVAAGMRAAGLRARH